MAAMNRIGIALIVLASSLLPGSPGGAGQLENRPDHPGTVAVPINRRSPVAGATAQELAAFERNLEHLCSLLLAAPTFVPPSGVEVTGWLSADLNEPVNARVPIRGAGPIQYFSCSLNEKTGLPARSIVTTAEVIVSVNVPHGGLGPVGLRGLYHEPVRTGGVNGFPCTGCRTGNGAYLRFEASGSVTAYVMADVSRSEAGISVSPVRVEGTLTTNLGGGCRASTSARGAQRPLPRATPTTRAAADRTARARRSHGVSRDSSSGGAPPCWKRAAALDYDARAF
jgi:hypothetical protein